MNFNVKFTVLPSQLFAGDDGVVFGERFAPDAALNLG